MDLIDGKIFRSEQDGKKWLAKAISFVEMGDYDSFNEHMKLAKEDFRVEYEIIGCMDALADVGATIEDGRVNPQAVSDIQIVSEKPLAYGLTTPFGAFNFIVVDRNENRIPNSLRKGQCHEGAFEIAKKVGDNARLVTARISALSDINTFIHSWVEDEDTECAFDYTLNIAIGIQNYRGLMHAQPSLIEVSSKDIRAGKIQYDEWGKKVQDLYR